MTLNQLSSLGPSALNTREGLSFLLGYAKYWKIPQVEEAVLQIHIDCIVLCDPYSRDIDSICELMQIGDMNF